MNTIREKAWAKLNISLDVTGRRADGYHNMAMIMQTVSLCDELEISFNASGRVYAHSSVSFIPGDERNLAVRAALRFLSETGREGQGMSISLKKRIPVGAGMGGGSSDAAAVLRALNRHYGNPLSVGALTALACDIGSDVPFCVSGGTALATGRGELLTALPDIPPCRFVICKPEFSISTPELFRKLSQCALRAHPDTAGLVAAIERGDLNNVCRRMYNVFEDVDDRRLRTVAEIKSVLLDHGALGSIMTGTGSAVFGVFPPSADTAAVVTLLRQEYGFCEAALPVAKICE